MKLVAKTGFELEVTFSPRHQDQWGNSLPYEQFKKTNRPDSVLNMKPPPNRRRFGKVHYSGDSYFQRVWKCGYDGGGLEFKSPVFYSLAEMEAVHQLCKVAYNKGLRPNYVAGTHIHIFTRDITEHPANLAGFQRFCAAVEGGIFSLSSPCRINNPNCPLFGITQKTIDLKAVKKEINKPVNGVSQSYFHNQYRVWPRGNFWAGLNELMTLEFRTFPSTLNAVDLINWMKVLNLLVKKWHQVEDIVMTWDTIPIVWPKWYQNIHDLDIIADGFMTFLNAPDDIHQWAVSRAAEVYHQARPYPDLVAFRNSTFQSVSYPEHQGQNRSMNRSRLLQINDRLEETFESRQTPTLTIA